MLTHSIWQPTPPISMVLFDFFYILILTKIKPEKGAFAMFFILWEVSDVDIAILVHFYSISWFFV